jgi:phosphinothricin acetyltransferase
MNNSLDIRIRRIEPGTPGLPGDARAVAAIYDDAVRTTTATFDTEPKTIRNRAEWLASHDARFSAFIAEDPEWKGSVRSLDDDAVPESADLAGQVVGWATLSRWSERRAYDGTGEVSVYVRPDVRGRRVGTKLLGALVEHARASGFHVLLARIVAGNEASERAHAAAGFERIGTMREVGRKFDRWLDVGMWQLML